MIILHDKNLGFFENELSKYNSELGKWWKRLKNKEELFALLNNEDTRKIGNFNYNFHKNEHRNNLFWFQISPQKYGVGSSIEYQHFELASKIKEILKINRRKFMTIRAHDKYIKIIKFIQEIQSRDYIPFDIKNLEYNKIATIITICEAEIKKLKDPKNYTGMEKVIRDEKLIRLENIKKYLEKHERE